MVRMRRMTWLWGAGWVVACGVMTAAMAGCTSSPAVSADPAERDRELSEGYALLHGLLEQNRQVDQAMRIPFRSVSDDTAALLRDIATASGEGADALRDMAEAAPTIGLDETGLPVMEQATRDAIEASSRHALLFGDTDRFERYLLLSQAEATRYAVHLAGQLAEADEQAGRREMLREISERFEQLYDRVVERFAVR